jgi:hypothetical protein
MPWATLSFESLRKTKALDNRLLRKLEATNHSGVGVGGEFFDKRGTQRTKIYSQSGMEDEAAGVGDERHGRDAEHLSVTIVTIGFVCEKPHSNAKMGFTESRILPGLPIDKAPTIRIFGYEASGKKTCIHVHQVCNKFCFVARCCLSTRALDTSVYLSALSRSATARLG